MNEAQKKYLTKRLVDLQCAMEERTTEKNDLVKAYNRLNTKDKAYISAYSNALFSDSSDPLEVLFSETEFAEFSKVK